MRAGITCGPTIALCSATEVCFVCFEFQLGSWVYSGGLKITPKSVSYENQNREVVKGGAVSKLKRRASWRFLACFVGVAG